MKRCRGQVGAAEALGFVMMTPVLVGLATIVVMIGRDVDRRAEVTAVSAAAATVAAQQRSVGRAVDLATAVAAELLSESSTCERHRIAIDTSRFGPGGIVTVTIDCQTSTAGGSGFVGDGPMITGSSSAAIDPYRALP